MIQIQGLWWPDDVQSKWVHAFKHVRSIEFAISRCPQRRTAVQAGGNIGLWPRRLAKSFGRVVTFEPDAISRECLSVNVPFNVDIRPEALGQAELSCGLIRDSLGSHYVTHGSDIPMVALDELDLPFVDLIQLDIEGYEWHALDGARATLKRSRPLVQVELRGFSERYGKGDQSIRDLLGEYGYVEVSRQPGADVVFEVPR